MSRATNPSPGLGFSSASVAANVLLQKPAPSTDTPPPSSSCDGQEEIEASESTTLSRRRRRQRNRRLVEEAVEAREEAPERGEAHLLRHKLEDTEGGSASAEGGPGRGR